MAPADAKGGDPARLHHCPLAVGAALAAAFLVLLLELRSLGACWSLAQPGGHLAALRRRAEAEDLAYYAADGEASDPEAPADDGEGEGEGEGASAAAAASGAASAASDDDAAAAPLPALEGKDAGNAFGSLARVYVINVKQAADRWRHMSAALGPAFGRGGLPPMERFDAATPTRDGCDLPYSLSDCCTVSHQRVLKQFGADDAVRDDQWVLILEDDVALHPAVSMDNMNEVILDGLSRAARLMSPFVYLGLCGPMCYGAETALVTASGATVTFHSHCGGSCTHAYAVQKFIAHLVPDFIQQMRPRARTIDAALSMMATALNMSLLGSSFSSPDVRAAGTTHTGVFYMKSFDDSLTSSFEWDTRLKVVVRLVEWSGRVGNLMFQWAATVALASKVGAETQAYFPASKYVDKPECPASSFFTHFRLQRFSRDLVDLRNTGIGKDGCTVFLKERGPNMYKEEDVKQVLKELATIRKRNAKYGPADSERCKVVEVVVQGFFQSWKYFKDFNSTIRTAFQAPLDTKAKADAWLGKVRGDLQKRYPGHEFVFVGVQVRRGDKIRNSNFASVYFNVDWAFYRTGMRMLEKRLKKLGSARTHVAFIVTAGGSMSSNEADVAETRAALKRTSDNVFISDNTDPFVDLAILSSCDGLVISPGSFGWWAAYLSPAGEAKGLVIAPQHVYRPTCPLSKGYSVADYYPKNWDTMKNDVSDDKS